MLSQNSYTLTNSSITSLKIEYYNKINKSVSLKSGWNILSVPLLKADMKTTSLFPTAVSLAYSYNSGYTSADSLKNGKGYWLRFNSDTTYNILGINVSPKNMNVITGWNLIGPFDENIPVSSVISSPSGIITSSFYGFSNMYFITDTLKAGKGYWIKTSAAGTLMKSSADNPVSLASVNTDSVNSWTKIIFTDTENTNSELYLANADQISQNYDLPPVPPEGIFDVRFGSDKQAEIFGKEHIIKINTETQPVKIKATNLKNHRIRLKDGVTGNLFNVVLSEGVEVELNQGIDNLILTDEGIIPADYSLSQNYPNPFNPSTTIKYDVPEDGSVRIVIYDMLGKEVQTLVNQFVKAGSYDVRFNASNFSSGIYIYKMQSGTFSEIKRMVLLK
ncbi:MAG: T9SS type A sorting domain-containing protein [Ignavibacteria bacterium]|nr:T9SS type A sorting domain-containing protein [Ignavibacteria bacterium]